METRNLDVEEKKEEYVEKKEEAAESSEEKSGDGVQGVAAERKKRKLPILIAVVLIAVLAAAVFVWGLIFKGGSSKAPGDELGVIVAETDGSGTAFIPTMDGGFLEIKGDVKKSYLTEDRQKVIVLEQDGILYHMNKNLEEKTKIADDAVDFTYAGNDGIVFQDKEDITYRYTFKDNETTPLGKDVNYIVSASGMHILFARASEKTVHILPGNSKTDETISAYEGEISLRALLDDGKTAVWTDKDSSSYYGDDSYRIILYDGQDRMVLDTVEADRDIVYVSLNKTNDSVIIANYENDTVYIKKQGKEAVAARLGNSYDPFSIYTSSGLFTSSGSFDGIYVNVDTEEGYALYYVNMDGDREKLLPRVDDFLIVDGLIYYTDTDRTLYRAKVNGSKISDELKIATDVRMIDCSGDGTYIYYAKQGFNEGTVVLYCLKKGKTEPVKIASDAACLDLEYTGVVLAYYEISTDGKTIYYWKDMENNVGDTYHGCGTLMSYTYGDKESVKIGTDVLKYSLESRYKTGYINPNAFIYKKYVSVDSDKRMHFDWVFFDGKESRTIIRDLIR